MGCWSDGTFSISFPSGHHQRRIRHCPICERRRRFVVFVDDSPYYAPMWTCCGCGDSWTDGELHPRPFAREWRQRQIAKAKRHWQEVAA